MLVYLIWMKFPISYVKNCLASFFGCSFPTVLSLSRLLSDKINESLPVSKCGLFVQEPVAPTPYAGEIIVIDTEEVEVGENIFSSSNLTRPFCLVSDPLTN